MTMTSSSLSDPSSSAAAAATTVTAVASTHDPDMHRQPLQLLDQQQQQQLQLQDQHHHPHQLQHHHHHQLQHQLQHQQKQWSSSIPLDEPSLASKPITLNVSRFSRDCTASVVFCLRYSNQTTLAPWSSIYIPKNYRLPIPGQRQSSPGKITSHSFLISIFTPIWSDR
ncbi:hypothetical protein BC939DRAFT_245772 [Gamsiella multidivaricata]|uniref:uncharacterized protein n=1 Tax=Gamsiella multidivaricata TaxID=101098 RepID=UPI00221EC8E0|nr:uncharacterized protein BC939DRAFT_245772 [Gamsiella multidivaricata]KAI7819912.1 hypothetical protein BC939DRAFT_245772 [Gamsiella multidivaricata]